MKVVTITYDISAKKWSDKIPSQLDSERTMVLAFGPVELIDAPQPMAEVVRAFPRSHVVGCSTGGAIAIPGPASSPAGAVQDDILTVTITQFEKTTMSLAQAQHAEAFTAGQMLGKKLSKPSLRAVVVFADGVEVSGSELVRGLNSTLDQSTVVVGGLAGDGTRFRRTWVLAGPNMKSSMAVAVGLYGEHIAVAHATRSGWTRIGDELTVTKSDGRLIYELDGKPALPVYEERMAMAGASQIPLPLALPLAVRASARHDKSLVRTVLGVDSSKQALTLAVDVPQGYLVQPLMATPETLLEAARDASSGMKESQAPVGSDSLVLAVSHAARRVVLGSHRASDEIQAALGSLPAGTKGHVTGFYGFGEVAPSKNGHSDLNNQSFTISMLMESEQPIARKGSRGLAGGATRAQGAATASGPAAHLRSRHQTVDDLFSELEIEGGKVGERRPQIRQIKPSGAPSAPASSTAPPIPRAGEGLGPRRGPPAPVAVKGANGTNGGTSALPPPVAPPHVGASGAGASSSRAPASISAVTPTKSAGAGTPATMSCRSFAFGRSKWTIDPLPTELDGPQTLVVAIGDPTQTAPVEALTNAFSKSHLVGCSGGILRRIGTTASLSVNTATFLHTKVSTAWADLALGAGPAGQAIAQKLLRPDLRAILLFVDGFNLDADGFLRAMSAALPSNVKVSGGVTASTNNGKEGWILCNSLVRPGIVAAAGFYGDHLVVSNGVRTGFEGFGPERHVTRAAGNVVYELDGRPALAVYTEYLARSTVTSVLRPDVALPFPLGVKGKNGFAPRMPLSLDRGAQSITFAAEIPNDSTVRLMRGTHEKLLNEVGVAMRNATLGAMSGDGLVLAISSSGRSLSLGDRSEEEVEVIVESVPETVTPHITGFYSRAEIGMSSEHGRPELTNESISITLFTESPVPLTDRASASERLTTRAPSIPTSNAVGGGNPAETPNPAQAILRTQNMHAMTPPPPPLAPAVATGTGKRKTTGEIVRPSLSTAGGGGGGGGAKITRRQIGDIMLVTFAGRLSESFKGEFHGRELAGTVVFDLGNVERITSFGVREWLTMLNVSNDKIKKLYFANCSEAIVNQLSMIRKFAGNAQIVSFFAPYLCDSCGEQFERLFDCETDVEAIRKNEPPESVCHQCSGKSHFDDDPETYFSFAPTHLGQPIPPNVRDVLNEIEVSVAASGGTAADSIEKVVEGEVTRVRVKTKLGAGLRWQRILDGIEGSLVIDLGGVASLDATGVQNFEHALSTLGPEVEAVRVERCPQAVVDRFVQTGLPKRLIITSVVLTGFCQSCNVQRPTLLVVDEHIHNLSAGRDPSLNCKRCNGMLTLVDMQPLLQFLARSRRRPSMQPRSTPPPPVTSMTGTSPGRSLTPGTGSLPPVGITGPMMPGMAIASDAPSGLMQQPAAQYAPLPPQASSGRGVIAGAAILSVAILLSAGFFAYARAKAASTQQDTPPVADTSAGAKPVSSVKLGDLPPGWVERPFVEENGMLYIVGRCERAPSAEAALSQARYDAINRIVQQLYTDLTATPQHEYLTTQPKIETTGPRASQVAEKYLRQAGTIAQPDRGETVVRQKDGGVEAFARYRLSRPAYNQAKALYTATSSFQGATIARAFPLLDVGGKDDPELVITSVQKTGRLGETAHVGDFILRMNGKPLLALDALNKSIEEWNTAPAGTSFDVDVKSNGVTETMKLKKQFTPYVYRPPTPPPPVAPPRPPPGTTTVATPPPPASTPPKPPPASSGDKDLGIIPPARTF